MQLDQITIALRPRAGWEAIDLGFRMAAHWARPLWSVWFAVYLPVGLGLVFALREQPLLAAMLLWWAKPLFDRFLLHVLSRAVFGHTPHWGETLRAWREILHPGLIGSLFTRFWDLLRSFTLPVLQLERQRGAAARARRKVLRQRAGGFAAALTLICIHLEMIVMVGLYSLTALFSVDVQLAPEDESMDMGFEQFFSLDWWAASDTLVYMLAVSLIEPFYVAAGFALYLNRRVLLEGWDVEVAMRRLAQRQRERVDAGRHVVVMLVGALLLGGLLLHAPMGQAQAAEEGPSSTSSTPAEAPADDAGAATESAAAGDESEDEIDLEDEEEPSPQLYQPVDTPARKLADEVIADPLFGSEREVERWRPLNKSKETPAAKPRSRNWFTDLMGVLAELFRIAAWIGLGVLLVALALLLARQRRGEKNAPEPAAPTTLFGLAINPESLPADIVAAARAALAAGQLREALSLLYRGALSTLVHARGLRVGAGATEADVLRLAQARAPGATAGFFQELLPAWMESAYAARLPTPVRVEQLCAAYAASLAADAIPVSAEAS